MFNTLSASGNVLIYSFTKSRLLASPEISNSSDSMLSSSVTPNSLISILSDFRLVLSMFLRVISISHNLSLSLGFSTFNLPEKPSDSMFASWSCFTSTSSTILTTANKPSRLPSLSKIVPSSSPVSSS